MFDFFSKKKREEPNVKEILEYLKKSELNVRKLSRRLEKIEDKSSHFFQKLGVVRFNPFKEVGGNQSFSIALLDAEDNGFVITNLYSREGNRSFGKPIKNGLSEYSLSKEEEEAIERAKARKS